MKKRTRKATPKARSSGGARAGQKTGPKVTRKPVSRGKQKARKARTQRTRGVADEVTTSGLLDDRIAHPESSPRLTGGDVDADWQRAASDGEEAVGGSVATPDQDTVDEIGRALGVEPASTAPVVPAGEVLRDRDRRRWELERRAARRGRGRQH